MADAGFYGLSVFAALDGDILALCQRIDRLRSPGTRPSRTRRSSAEGESHDPILTVDFDRVAETI